MTIPKQFENNGKEENEPSIENEALKQSKAIGVCDWIAILIFLFFLIGIISIIVFVVLNSIRISENQLELKQIKNLMGKNNQYLKSLEGKVIIPKQDYVN